MFVAAEHQAEKVETRQGTRENYRDTTVSLISASLGGDHLCRSFIRSDSATQSHSTRIRFE